MKQEQPALEQACMSEGSTGRGPRHYISLLVDGMGDGIPDKDPRSGLGQQQPRPGKVSVALQRSDTAAHGGTSTHRPYCSVYSGLLQAPLQGETGIWRAILWVNGYVII